jgi:hypothetical protein
MCLPITTMRKSKKNLIEILAPAGCISYSAETIPRIIDMIGKKPGWYVFYQSSIATIILWILLSCMISGKNKV